MGWEIGKRKGLSSNRGTLESARHFFLLAAFFLSAFASIFGYCS
jgi:hypothetical protein